MYEQGHGHVTPRSDGQRMRCGGPGFCKECSLEQARKWKEEEEKKKKKRKPKKRA